MCLLLNKPTMDPLANQDDGGSDTDKVGGAEAELGNQNDHAAPRVNI